MGQVARQVNPQDVEKQLKMTEAIISSMTVQERRHPKILNANRRRRIAKGSGTDVQDVNRLIKQHRQMGKMLQQMKNTGFKGLPNIFK
jgi:signal recognition particle subunit SRP54